MENNIDQSELGLPRAQNFKWKSMSYKREQIKCTERAHIKNRKETMEMKKDFGTANKKKFKHRERFNLQQIRPFKWGKKQSLKNKN